MCIAFTLELVSIMIRYDFLLSFCLFMVFFPSLFYLSAGLYKNGFTWYFGVEFCKIPLSELLLFLYFL
jgi:hypothetical protein